MEELNKKKYNQIKNWFSGHPKIMVALSGGVDSCLAAFLARHFAGRENVIAVIGDSPSLKRRDYNQALEFCNRHDISYHAVSPGEINDPRYNSNPEDRCFWCKNSLYTVMGDLREQKFKSHTMINGSNKSDLGDYRPGLKAADKYKVLSPLADCEFVKDDIREMARYFDLHEWDKPASPCLSSRFPYGEGITIEKLKMVEQAEELITRHGFKDVRTRYRSGSASIEVPANDLPRLTELMPELNKQLKTIGFKDSTVDEEGFVSGKLNRAIGKK